MRPSPFDLVFRQSASEAFPSIRAAFTGAGHDPRDRDRFLMQREVVTVLRDLRPEKGLGEGIDQLAALLHHAYLFWDADEPTLDVTAEGLPTLLATPFVQDAAEPVAAYYAAMPERRVWAQVLPAHPPEPLDGCFAHLANDNVSLRVLGVFGIHPEREGFSVVEVVGPRPPLLARDGGSDLFSPTLTGGKAAGLFSILGEEELLELGWRTRSLARQPTAEASRWRA